MKKVGKELCVEIPLKRWLVIPRGDEGRGHWTWKHLE